MIEKFNYFEFVKAIENVSLAHPLVESFYIGKYLLNSTDDVVYPAVILTINNINVGNNVTLSNVNMMYVDRLTEHRDNIVYIQSTGIDTITEIINALKENYFYDSEIDLSFNLFKEQFADNTAGVYAPLSLISPSNIGECYWYDVDRRFY